MDIDKRIIFFENGSPCIFFPVGKTEDGGTCAYITDECLAHCPSAGVVHEHEKRALKYFKENPAYMIQARIIGELRYFESNFLGWFSWGDCPPELEDKICDVILGLNKFGIVQNGFTRNRKLWEKIPKLPSLRFSFSMDNIYEVECTHFEKTICCPDTSRAEARVFVRGKLVARCSGYFCTHYDTDKTEEADCSQCYGHERGCFS